LLWFPAGAAGRGPTPLTIDIAPGAPAHAVLRAPGREPVSLTIDAADASPRHVALPEASPPPPAARPSAPAHHHHDKGAGEFKAIED
jgi:hypothetical protein